MKKFQGFLDHLPENVFRAKGILWFRESQIRHIMQLSGRRCEMQTDDRTADSNQLVLIGRNLNAESLQQQLTECLV